MQQREQLDSFLAGIQQRAFRIALASLAQREDALDAVQDAMCKLVEKYCHKPAGEWAPLFYRILYSRITDIQRRRSSRGKVFGTLFFAGAEDRDGQPDPIAQVADASNPDPARYSGDGEFGEALQQALRSMPERQRQAFLLRAWEGLDVAQTARAMGCSAGSVKTHYSRARQFLQRELEGFSDASVNA
ncbi:MAG: RNA polymerase sigma factor [Gammaproteobacteria bacterium]|nr:RNA polymerase sigma factor [Gammaproteobacteria bacterium]